MTASVLGLTYASAPQLVAGPFEELLRRVKMVEQMQASHDPNVVTAIIGGPEAPKPSLRLSELVGAFEEAQAASLSSMSEEQLKRWRTNKLRAIRVAIGAIGSDKPVVELSREDGIAFRRHFQNLVKAGELVIKSANIEMGHLTKMLRVVEMERQLGIPLHAFANLSIEGGEERHRPPFPTDFIRQRLLAEGALDGLDAEARGIVLVMVETGMRPSEIMNLLPQHIHLSAPVPYVSVRADGRRLKTKPSVRNMPLVGCALEAMKLHPNGFPTYRNDGGALSKQVNDYLTEKKLRPTQEHSLYGLRHSFEDRLTALDAPDKIIGRLMGHKGYREKYGDGPSLEHLQGWMKRIAFRPPVSV